MVLSPGTCKGVPFRDFLSAAELHCKSSGFERLERYVVLVLDAQEELLLLTMMKAAVDAKDGFAGTYTYVGSGDHPREKHHRSVPARAAGVQA